MRTRPVLAALTLACAGSAQVSPLCTSGGVVVRSGAATATAAPGAPLDLGAHLAVGGGAESAAFTFEPRFDEVAVEFVCDLHAAAFAAANASSGGITLHELWAARPIDGRFVVTWTPAASGTSAASFQLDLFDDQVVDATGSAVIACQLPAGLTRVRIVTAASASAGVIAGPWGTSFAYHGAASGHLAVRFEAAHCSSTVFGSACAGPAVQAVGNLLGGATLTAQATAGDDLAVLLLALDQQTTPHAIAPGCTLLAAPLASLWQPLPATGLARWSTSLPPGIGAIDFAAQVVAVDLDPLRVTASQGLWLHCR